MPPLSIPVKGTPESKSTFGVATGTLSFNGYNSGAVFVPGEHTANLIIKLTGSNTITGQSMSLGGNMRYAGIANPTLGGGTTITSDNAASLNISINAAGQQALGIYNEDTASTRGNITISGFASVKLTITGTQYSSGLYGKNIAVLENASVEAVVSSSSTMHFDAFGISATILELNTTGNVLSDISGYTAGRTGLAVNISGGTSQFNLYNINTLTIKWNDGGSAGTEPSYDSDIFDVDNSTERVRIYTKK